MKITSQDIRCRLPGFETVTTLVSDGNGSKIDYVFRITGFMSQLESSASFWVYYKNEFLAAFATIEEARLCWERNMDIDR